MDETRKRQLIETAYREAVNILTRAMDVRPFNDESLTEEEDEWVRAFIREHIIPTLERGQ